ncbi:MAG TPA: imidazole glycerol phosphate synthase subunit HisH [Microthrixaceae bacterium]|nr:imidazole glycerol phosphate synthase subunit HisH [Microthrixaceae bacterium]
MSDNPDLGIGVGAPQLDENEVGTASGVPRIAVLDYGIGNLRSAQKAFEFIGVSATLTSDADEAARADAVVLPGVGSFGPCREALARTGLDKVVIDAVASGKPFLGICVGMQLLYDGSEESPGVAGLGVLPGMVRRIPAGVKHPQMQWNRLDMIGKSPLFEGLGERPWMYFVHSFAAELTSDVVATCEYGATLAAVAQSDNVYATQFHPEKSGVVGLEVLRNFARVISAETGSATASKIGHQ